MNLRTITSVALLAVGLLTALAQSGMSQEGRLSADVIRQLDSTFRMDRQTRAVFNAVTNSDVKSLVLNRDILRQNNEFFSDKVKVKGITNQASSGRCWMFAGLNSLRPAVIVNHKLDGFEFSQNYLEFWDKLEKANTFLQYIIDFRDRDLMDRELVMILRGEPGDGGYFEGFADLVTKYGVVPKEVMPETHSSSNTRTMNRLFYQKLRSDAVKLRRMHAAGRSLGELVAAKRQMLAVIYRFLVVNLGQPPYEFTWRYKAGKNDSNGKQSHQENAKENGKRPAATHQPNTVDRDKTSEITTTPQAFFRDFVGVDMNDFVNVFNDTTHTPGKHYQIRLSRNMIGGHDINYVNVEINTLKQIAIRSIQDGTPLVFAADVSYDQSKDHGIMATGLYDYESLFGLDIQMTKAERALYRSSVRNHGMVLVGVDLDGQGKPIKWRVENSWGTSKGSKGYWTMYDNWFDLHVYNIIANKKYVPRPILKIKNEPAIVLPPWDPMM